MKQLEEKLIWKPGCSVAKQCIDPKWFREFKEMHFCLILLLQRQRRKWVSFRKGGFHLFFFYHAHLWGPGENYTTSSSITHIHNFGWESKKSLWSWSCMCPIKKYTHKKKHKQNWDKLSLNEKDTQILRC